jgi:hypothetical protein
MASDDFVFALYHALCQQPSSRSSECAIGRLLHPGRAPGRSPLPAHLSPLDGALGRRPFLRDEGLVERRRH